MQSQSKYVVINGDDFGYSEAVNQAIIQAHRQGILSSTSLMVTADKFSEAVSLAKENPNLGVGLHLVLCCGKSALPPQDIPTLVDKDGYFHDSAAMAGWQYQFLPSAKDQLKREIKAQLDLFKETGLPLSHVDGHLHLHTHPLVMKILTELAQEYQIKYIRLPLEELSYTLGCQRLSSGSLLLKIIYHHVFHWLRLSAEKRLSAYKVKCLQRVYGLLQTGMMSESYLLCLIPQIQTIFNEIYFHPQSIKGDQEFQALCSEKVKDMLSSKGFEIVNYLQLEEKMSRC